MINILELTGDEARTYFLQAQNYCNIKLPRYYNFQPLLDSLSNSKAIKDVSLKSATKSERVNYKFYHNKDGNFAWRQFQIINPVIYINLVDLICDKTNWEFLQKRFEQFRQNDRIQCCSIPLVSDDSDNSKSTAILNWWEEVEQRSIELALDYPIMLNTDVTDCYGSLYTHSISWALHDIERSKENRALGKKELGDNIDEKLRSMSYGQTNGIPQGSVLMDFVAEMVLGYVDMKLSQRIESYNQKNEQSKIVNYHILRYRDDYRIFANSDEQAVKIAKILTEELAIVNFRINSNKTFISKDIVKDSIKPDKYHWNAIKSRDSNLQKRLLQIHYFANLYPNSGVIEKELTELYEDLYPIKLLPVKRVKVLISILVDIAYNSPRIYYLVSAIIGKLLLLETETEVKQEAYESLRKKLSRLPNVGYLEIWLQRMTLKINYDEVYDEAICKKVIDDKVDIWDMSWITNPKLQQIIQSINIIDKELIESMPELASPSELGTFNHY